MTHGTTTGRPEPESGPEGHLVCPACGGALAPASIEGAPALACRACERSFPVVLGIPDLRIFDDPYIDAESDREKGRLVGGEADAAGFEELVRFYYAHTPRVPPEHADQYTRGLLAAEARSVAAHRLRCSHASPAARPPRVLSVGCGTAPGLAAGAGRFGEAVGVDIAFRWLVVGSKRLRERGVSAGLYCCCAEALPFPDASFDLVVADYVLAYVSDRGRTLAEIRRVLRPGGVLWIAAANRWSLGPDPQTGLPAGGWLPGAVVDWWVRRKGGIPPERRLLSVGTLRRMLDGAGFADVEILLPAIPREQREAFGSVIRAAARAYEVLRRWPLSAPLLRVLGPSFLAVARTPVTGPDGAAPEPRRRDE